MLSFQKALRRVVVVGSLIASPLTAYAVPAVDGIQVPRVDPELADSTPTEPFEQITFGLGEWDACGITLDGRGLCFPAPYNGSGEQDIPDLADLVLK